MPAFARMNSKMVCKMLRKTFFLALIKTLFSGTVSGYKFLPLSNCANNASSTASELGSFRRRLIFSVDLLCLAIATASIQAQSPSPRILSAARSFDQIPLPGSHQPAANPEFDAGRVPAGTRLNGITIAFCRSASQEAGLDALLAAQQDPTSPSFHKWLTPDEFAARFGIAQADIDHVTSWLQQQGFSIDSVNRSRNAIRLSGSVGQVNRLSRLRFTITTLRVETFRPVDEPFDSGGFRRCGWSCAQSD